MTQNAFLASTAFSNIAVGSATVSAVYFGSTKIWEASSGVTWTNPDLANASYDSVSFSVTSQEQYPVEITFNDDGSKMYVMGLFSRNIYQYSLSTEFDVSTASYDSVSFSVGSQLSQAGAFVFNNNGTKLYATGEGGDAIFQYSLSTAYDISTASYDSVTLDVSPQEAGPNAIEISTDGTKMYIVGWQNDTVFQYTLTSAFDLSTASYANKSFSVATQESAPLGLRFNPDGTRMYITGYSNDKVRQYTLSTAYDVSTASYDSVDFSVNSQESNPHAMVFKNDGSKLYVLGWSNDTIYQYSTQEKPCTLSLQTVRPTNVTWPTKPQMQHMPMEILWSSALTVVIALVGWILKSAYEEITRLSILLSRTREEFARDYARRDEVNQAMARVMDRLDTLDAKIDRLIEAGRQHPTRITNVITWGSTYDRSTRLGGCCR